MQTKKERPVSLGAGDQISPATDGDRVVWEEDGANGEGDIYAFDLKTGKQVGVCTADGSQNLTEVSGGRVVWEDLRGATIDIHAFNLATGTEYPLNTSDGMQAQPTIWVQ